MGNTRRVVITGIGVVSPNGIGKDAFWQALQEGRSGISKVSRFDTSIFPASLAGEVRDFNPLDFLPPKKIQRTDRSTHFVIAATSMAIKDARLELTNRVKEETNVLIGTALSGHLSYIEQLRIYFTKGYQSVSPFAAVSCFIDACSGQLSIFFGIKGPTETICAGCASSSNAIIEAYKRIKTKETDICIAGGTDAPIAEDIYCGFCQAGVLSQNESSAPSPFDKNRDGTVLSEGAGIVILEELNHSLSRNAPHIYGEIIGYGMTTDAYQMAGVEPTGEQRARAIKIALRTADIQPEEVDYISAHGTGTILNDANETKFIKEVFGKHAYKIPISSIKSMIGHTQGAAGVLEIISCLMVLNKGIIPPTINYRTPDPKCDLNYVPNKSISKEVNITVSNSFAFGGKNSIIVLKKFNG
ncbi:MAG: beta-ketoacyl-[acyl-carrier-protein] synthase family protein [Candidatus Omnitrophica bacterium]|nr:beta-ketoacyl-[acyl-carrier-protein] synthase family protein [Candidatus Omnitrophota bacterium]